MSWLRKIFILSKVIFRATRIVVGWLVFVVGLIYFWPDIKGAPKEYGYEWGDLMPDRETVTFVLLGLSLLYIIWMDLRPWYRLWREKNQPITAPQLVITTEHGERNVESWVIYGSVSNVGLAALVTADLRPDSTESSVNFNGTPKFEPVSWVTSETRAIRIAQGQTERFVAVTVNLPNQTFITPYWQGRSGDQCWSGKLGINPEYPEERIVVIKLRIITDPPMPNGPLNADLEVIFDDEGISCIGILQGIKGRVSISSIPKPIDQDSLPQSLEDTEKEKQR